MVSAEILNSHSVSTLKKELRASNVKGIAKMKKSEVVAEMLKRKEMFTHIKHKNAKLTSEDKQKKIRIIKPKKEEPKKEQPKPKQKTMVEKAIEKKAKAPKIPKITITEAPTITKVNAKKEVKSKLPAYKGKVRQIRYGEAPAPKKKTAPKKKAAKKDKYEIKPFVSKFVPTYTKQEQEMMKQAEMAENHANKSSDEVINKFDKLASTPEHDKEYKEAYEELLGKWKIVSLTPDVYNARFPERVKKLKKLGKKFKYKGEYSFKAYGI